MQLIIITHSQQDRSSNHCVKLCLNTFSRLALKTSKLKLAYLACRTPDPQLHAFKGSTSKGREKIGEGMGAGEEKGKGEMVEGGIWTTQTFLPRAPQNPGWVLVSWWQSSWR